LADFKVLFIHVANMNNKGTQALFSSDVSVIKEIVDKSSISVSTTDIPGVRRLNLPVEKVLPPVVDLPFDRADQLSERYGFKRGDSSYKLLTLGLFIMMMIQPLLLLFSIFLEKLGLKAFYRRELIESIRNSDLVISHSDENFKEAASLLPLNFYWVLTHWSMMAHRTMDVVAARSFSKPVIMFPNSCGPFRTWIGRFLARLSLKNCEHLFIRDPVSYKIVDDLGIDTPKTLTYDTALLFDQHSESISLVYPRPLLGVCAGIYSHSLSKSETGNYILSHARALDAVIEKHGFFVVFLPHYVGGFRNDDLYISELIVDEMKNKDRIRIVQAQNVSEFKQYLNQMDMIVSSKMHPAILASTGYVPTMCIAYDHKQTAFFQNLGMIDCVLNIRDVSYERLLSKIDFAWNKRAEFQEVLKTLIPQWQVHIRVHIKRVVNSYVRSGTR
jgi:polysaccharide pyruvyl transferase WcaK-like protein